MPLKAAFCCQTAALPDSSSLKFKVEWFKTYLALATGDHMYDFLKSSGTCFLISSCIFISQQSLNAVHYTAVYCILLGTNFNLNHICSQCCSERTRTHTLIPVIRWKESWKASKWCGGGTFEKGLNEFM